MTGLLPLLTLAVLSGAAASTPASDPAAGPATAVAATDALLRDYQGQVPGASVLVLRDGQPLYRRGHGLADLEAGTAATAQTNYRLASSPVTR